MKPILLACLVAASTALSSLPSALRQDAQAVPESPPPAEAWNLADIAGGLEESGHAWNAFLTRPDLDCGVYRLPAGATDSQSPHRFDEVYYVASGRARLTAGDDVFDVESGSIVYVEKEVPHRFHDIEEDLTVLVFFAKDGPEPSKASADEPGDAGEGH